MLQKGKGNKGDMVRFRTRLVAVTCAVAMVGSFWGSAGAIVTADAVEQAAEPAWNAVAKKLVFDTATDAKWSDKVYASNDKDRCSNHHTLGRWRTARTVVTHKPWKDQG